MGAELAVTASNNSTVTLNHFADTVIVKINLSAGRWIIMGRVLYNHDGDLQSVGAHLAHQATLVLDRVDIWATDYWRGCVYLQATLDSKRDETVTLSCSTYKGAAQSGSLIAFRVDDIESQ